MCGIAGWINLKDDIAGNREVIHKMTETLKKRGPDDFGYYTSRHVLLGHRRLVVVDPSGGAQPMTREFHGNKYTIVYNGELYNTEDLRQTLLEKGFSFQSYSDTEVLLVSYIAWGVDCVKHINGIYAFGVWDEKQNALFLARDPLGVKPLFYSLKNDSLIFGSEIKTLLAHPWVEPAVDWEGLCDLFGLGPGRSLGGGIFKDIKEIPPAHFLLYKKDTCKLIEYWKLKSEPHQEDLQTTVEHVRSLLVDAIERQLGADVPVCTFLSGGLDSSAISSIAASAFKRSGKGQLHTYSVDYVDNDIYFKENEYQPNSDSHWIGKMVDFIGSRHHQVLVTIPDLASALRDAVLASDLPGMADIDSSLFLFCKEVRKNATVAISGECADEIFGGYPWFRRKEDIKATTFPWSQALHERTKLLSKDFENLPLEEYVAEKYLESIKQVPKLDGEDETEHRMRELFFLNMKWFMITLLNRKDRMSMSNSLEVRVPFADYRIVEYAFNIPWSMKYCDGIEKSLLRRSLAGILPDEILQRRKSPYPKTHHPAYLQTVQEAMRSILQDKNSPILSLISKDRISEIVESGGKSFSKPWYGQLMTGPQLIAYLLQIDIWMREYNVKLI